MIDTVFKRGVRATGCVMSWLVRGKRRYFYETRWLNGRVVKKYRGTGLAGDQAAAEVERRRQDRLARAEAVRSEHERHQLATAALNRLCSLTDLLMKATLVSQGFYQHDRGEWRRRHYYADSKHRRTT
jgi:hypothetical protein